jgi:hypothetical protein
MTAKVTAKLADLGGRGRMMVDNRSLNVELQRALADGCGR